MPGAAPSVNTKYPWYLRGMVVHGHGRGGSKLGYPTANVQLDTPTVEALKPYNNLVLFGFGCIEGTPSEASVNNTAENVPSTLGPFPFAMSVGYNPQFKDVALSAEVHFLQTFDADFYGSYIRIVVLDEIRAMSAFTSLEELIRTINSDVERTKEMVQLEKAKVYETDPFVQPSAPLSKEILSQVPYFKVGNTETARN